LRGSPYYCPACDARIKRRSNALRHLEKVHHNKGVLYDRSKNPVDTAAKAAVPIWLDKKPRLDGGSLQGAEGSPGNDGVMPGHQPAIGEGNAGGGKGEDEVYFGRIGELGLPLDELDALLSDHFPHVKGKVLGMVMLEAFASQNPVKSFRESLSLCKSISCSNRIVDCISSYCSIPKPVASSLVRNSVLGNAKPKWGDSVKHRSPG
jgi:hypothetical protein